MAEKRRKAGPTEVNRLREEILAHVRGRAGEETGLFTLTVPTGGGKTLASLAFALDHAQRPGLARLVYAIPSTSLVHPTAAIFLTLLWQDVVLVHHSALGEEPMTLRNGPDHLRRHPED